MEGAHIDCGRRITDSLIERNVTILSHEQNIPKGHRLILGDLPQSPYKSKNITLRNRGEIKEKLRILGYIE